MSHTLNSLARQHGLTADETHEGNVVRLQLSARAEPLSTTAGSSPHGAVPVTACTRRSQLTDMDLSRRWFEAREDALPWFAERAVVVNDGGRTCLITREGGRQVERTLAEGKNFYQSFRVEVAGIDARGKRKSTCKAVLPIFITSPECRLYSRSDCDPSYTCGDDCFNTWEGVATDPVHGDCSRLKEHLLQSTCGGNLAIYEAVTDWFAHGVQRPWEKPGFGLVLQGGKGVGKSTIGRFYCEIIGPKHSITISKPKHLYGDFNEHQHGKLFILAEEVVWGGSKQDEGALKELLTGSTAIREAKGKDAVEQSSFARFMFVSNEGHVVPASVAERRFAFLRVSDPCSGMGAGERKSYFDQLHAEFENGGKQAWLAELLERDLSGFDRFRPPVTAGLGDQIKRSLPKAVQWLWAVLETGQLTTRDGAPVGKEWPLESSAPGARKGLERGDFTLVTGDLAQSFESHVRAHGGSTHDGGLGFLALLKDLDPNLPRVRLTRANERPWGYRVGYRRWWREAFERAHGVSFTPEMDESEA